MKVNFFAKNFLTLFVVFLFAGLSINKANAVEATLGGGMDVLFQSAMSGNNYKIWENRINGSNFSIPHIHPKLMLKFSDKLSAEIYECLSHGGSTTTLITAYLDYELYSYGDFGATSYNVKVGRFDMPFGYFNSVAINPVDQKSISRPLMWVDHDQEDMQLVDGPQPMFMSPWTEIGAQFYGNKWVRGGVDQVWFGIYVVNGLYQRYGSGTTDIEWLQEPRPTMDNNGNKSIGGRLAYSFGDRLTLGASLISGKYDANDKLKYAMYGGDFQLSLGKTNLRFEYASNPVDWIDNISLGTKKEYTKTGWYAQYDAPFEQVFKKSNFAKKFEFVTMYSDLRDNKDIANHAFSDISRFSIGINFAPQPALKFRLEYQLTMPGDYNNNILNSPKYGNYIKDLNRVQLDVGVAF